MARAAFVAFPPAIDVAFESTHAFASKYVERASPIPATNSLTGAFTIISVSIITISGFDFKNRYFSNSPSGVYTTDKALHGASVDAIVGTTITGISV